ncbi:MULTISPECIES: helix-turn-helix domain-containing protein [Amycolatopsis]|nr:helix-turn-helix transcriptional regulator [Amycolatopsis sacchari]
MSAVVMTVAARTPTGRRMQLAVLLRRLREQARLTQGDAGRSVWPSSSAASVQNKIARLESGDAGIKLEDLRSLLAVYGVQDAAVTDLALQLQSGLSQRGRWTGFRAVHDDATRRYIDLEEDATLIRLVAAEVVPEILQSPSYLRAEHPATRADAPELQAKLARQRTVLLRPDPAQFYAVLSESCVRRTQGDDAVLREQVAHLISLSRRPHITIQLVPFRPRGPVRPIARTGLLERFALLRLTTPEVPGKLPEHLDYAFTKSGADLTFSDHVRHYETLWTEATAAALTPAETRAFLTTVLNELD